MERRGFLAAVAGLFVASRLPEQEKEPVKPALEVSNGNGYFKEVSPVSYPLPPAATVEFADGSWQQLEFPYPAYNGVLEGRFTASGSGRVSAIFASFPSGDGYYKRTAIEVVAGQTIIIPFYVSI